MKEKEDIIVIGIVWNSKKDGAEALAEYIVDWFTKKNIPILVNEDNMFKEDLNFIIVLGGDGTILHTVKRMHPYSIPLLGINLGNLGFLTAVEKKNIDYYLEQSLDDENYLIENRMMLDVSICKDNVCIWKDTALNDIVLSRRSLSKILNFCIEVSDNPIANYFADGFIIGTPTGSTAYSLSAGGPILTPQMEAVVLTPICAHTLYARLMVVSAKEKVKLYLNEAFDENVVTIDGQRRTKLTKGEELLVEASEIYAKIIRFKDRSFFEVLAEKIGSRG